MLIFADATLTLWLPYNLVSATIPVFWFQLAGFFCQGIQFPGNMSTAQTRYWCGHLWAMFVLVEVLKPGSGFSIALITHVLCLLWFGVIYCVVRLEAGYAKIRTIYLPAFSFPQMFHFQPQGLDQNQFWFLSFSGKKGRRTGWIFVVFSPLSLFGLFGFFS